MTRGLRNRLASSGDLYSDNATITLQERPHEACRSFDRPLLEAQMFAGMAATGLPLAPGIAVLLRNLARRGLLPEPQ
jgi:hypothetical protein